jgi:hypothetical protein
MTFLPDFNQICSVSTDIHKVPNIGFHAGVFQDHAYAIRKCNCTSIHLYAIMERGGTTSPFKYLSHSQINLGWNRSVSIATEPWVGRSRNRIPVGGEIFRACPEWPWGPPSLLYNGYWVFPGGKVRLGRAADNSPPSSAKLMEE